MDEKKYSDQFVELFSPHFDLFPQVHLRHPISGPDIVIDFVGFCKNHRVLGPIGFEIKDPARWSGDGHFTAFTSALSQCMDYQNRLINSQLKNPPYLDYFGSRLRYTFLFPVAPGWAYSMAGDLSVSASRASGALRLAGKFGVGAACENHIDWALTLGCQPAFYLYKGPTDLFHKHAVNTRTGSAK